MAIFNSYVKLPEGKSKPKFWNRQTSECLQTGLDWMIPGPTMIRIIGIGSFENQLPCNQVSYDLLIFKRMMNG